MEITVEHDHGSAAGIIIDPVAQPMVDWLDENKAAVALNFFEGYHFVAVLSLIKVHSSVRGQGYGTKLMEEFLEESADNGSDAITLVADRYETQRPGFDLQEFYQGFGFEKLMNTSGGPLMVLDL